LDVDAAYLTRTLLIDVLSYMFCSNRYSLLKSAAYFALQHFESQAVTPPWQATLYKVRIGSLKAPQEVSFDG
jgi:hypothetical protein